MIVCLKRVLYEYTAFHSLFYTIHSCHRSTVYTIYYHQINAYEPPRKPTETISPILHKAQWGNGIKGNMTASAPTNSRDSCKPLDHGVELKLTSSYASQDKGSIEYDIEAERGWKQFIKTLDPEKKTVQACFASLVAVSPFPVLAQHMLTYRLQDPISALEIMFIGLDQIYILLRRSGIMILPMLARLDELAWRQ